MPQQTWTDKRERQYEHIKQSEEDRGRTEEKAEEIAARTVNKQRRESGETSNKVTQGTGNPNQVLEGSNQDIGGAFGSGHGWRATSFFGSFSSQR